MVTLSVVDPLWPPLVVKLAPMVAVPATVGVHVKVATPLTIGTEALIGAPLKVKPTDPWMLRGISVAVSSTGTPTVIVPGSDRLMLLPLVEAKTTSCWDVDACAMPSP